MKRSVCKRVLAMLLCGTLLCGTMASCKPPQAELITAAGAHGEKLTDLKVNERGQASLSAPIPLSGFEDKAGEDGVCKYQMRAELTDTYTFTCAGATKLCVRAGENQLDGEGAITMPIKKGDMVIVEATMPNAGDACVVAVEGKTYKQRLPYYPEFTVKVEKSDLYGDNTKEPAPTEISYKKREGGTYVYLNNPEKLQTEDYGKAILRDENLSGDVQVTWEHSNFTGRDVYLGYQLKNEGKTDVYVTVTNIGLQVEGEWLGQQSWSDYYNRKFDLPADYFVPGTDVVAEEYVGQDFIDYTPRVFQPTTYRIPAGKYIYVLGGTSGDAYNNTNVADTANKPIRNGCCTNGVAKFFVTGGAVTGTFYCYGTPMQVEKEPEEQGYIVERDGVEFGYQYKGVDYHTALIESNPVFIINDMTPRGSLPVTYENEYDERAYYETDKPYTEYRNRPHTQEEHSWTTNINQQSSHRGVGTDMSSFECVTTDGETVIVDNNRSDGFGKIANLGNWMIDYHDNMTFINQGDEPRTLTINKSANGALMAMVMDPSGKVLSTRCTIVQLDGSSSELQWELYSFELPAHSSIQLSVSFLLMGNSYGGVGHWIYVE